MKLNIELYRNSLPGIKTIYERNKDFKDLRTIANEACFATHVPIVACFYFIAELNGSLTNELTSAIINCIEFYKYEEILGIPECLKSAIK